MIIGTKAGLIVAAGGVALMAGVVGFALLFVILGRPATGRGRGGPFFLAFLSALLLAGGGMTVVFAGLVHPLQAMRTEVHSLTYYVENTLADKLDSTHRMRGAEIIRTILADPKYQAPGRLPRHEYKVFSQNGEDGIVAEIFRRIGTTNKYFVEFGSANGFECNSALLLRQGWSGFWIDGDPKLVAEATTHFRPEIEAKKLTVKESFITAENIEDLFKEANVPEEFDLLSVDIDRNDYYVWEKIAHYRPRAVIVEYNPVYPPTMSWVIPYDGKAWWDGTSRSGASLKALEELGKKKGYSLVGCCISGVNAFFVRDDLLGNLFAPPYTAENHYEPARYDLYWKAANFPRVP